jgi:IS4 transposase
MTISLLYKNRWAIEVLFKQIKQNFEVKYFLSDTETGIKSQIWVALILNLLFTVLHKMIKGAEDFSTMVSIAAKNLCSYVNLVMFLKMPQTYCNALYKKEIRNIQLNLFSDSGGG